MPKAKITKRIVDQLDPDPMKPVYVYDTELSGFGIRIGQSGAKSYFIEFRPGAGGRSAAKKRVTLGSHGQLTPDLARQKAQLELARVRLGHNPAEERRAERASPTLSELIDSYLNEEVRPKKKASTHLLYRLYFDRHVRPELGSKKAEHVTHADIARLHKNIGEKARVTANRVLDVVSGVFSFGMRRGKIRLTKNPAGGVEKFSEVSRERYLTSDEISRLGTALLEAETIGLPWELREGAKAKHRAKDANQREVFPRNVSAAIRLLLLTGCRLREILHLRWHDVDLERGILFLPDSKTGRRAIVLSAAAMDVISGLDRAGDFVILGATPKAPRSDLKRPWRRISARAGLAGVRIHDLRHSFASIGAGSSLGLPILGKLLGHSQPTTTARYAHLDVSPLRTATDQIGRKIAAALASKVNQNVDDEKALSSDRKTQ